MTRYAIAFALLLSAVATAGAPAFAEPTRRGKCYDCPPAKKYDSEEVIHTSRDIDRSRVINTTTVVPVSRRVKETNHLVIHRNVTRNVGVIRHRHTIIEKERRYVVRRPVDVVVQYVVQRYRVMETPALYRTVPVAPRRVKHCYDGRSSRNGRCVSVVRVRG